MVHHNRQAITSTPDSDTSDAGDDEDDVEELDRPKEPTVPSTLQPPFSREDIYQYGVVSCTQGLADQATLIQLMAPAANGHGQQQLTVQSSPRRQEMRSTGTLMPYQHTEFNLAREQCSTCKASFSNQEMYERHRRQFIRSCTTCGRSYLCCQPEIRKYFGDHPYCKWNCKEHGQCFSGKKEAHRHLREKRHYHCFLDHCEAEEAYEVCTQKQLERHFASAHR